MLINHTKRILTQPQTTSFILIFKTHKSSTTSTPKLTSSYFHHVSSLPLQYKTISQSFDETAAKYPDHECYVFKSEQKRYTYKSFKHEVDSLAASLLELGFEKNDRFAVWLPNTSQNVAMTFAASKLGLIKVNINPAYVERELEYCINKVGCKGLILPPSVKIIPSLSRFRQLVPELDQSSTTRELSSKTLPTLKHVVLTGDESSTSGVHSYNKLIEHGSKLSHEKLNERQASINPDSPVTIYYTSGTTGQPKAATLTNFAILNLVHAQWEHLGRFFTRLCVPIPMFHIFSEVVGVLNIAVAKCKIIFPDVLPDTVSTMKAIHEEKCTGLLGAPIIFRDILGHPDKKNYDLSSLEFGALGASPMHISFLRQIEKEMPITRASQGYGMTEQAAIFSSGFWAGDEDSERRLGSMGKIMQGLEVKIADEHGNAVPIGQQGEIWSRGFSMMVGYYNDPEKTKETLTPSGWLRTGDEGKMDEDGFLYYISRRKEMIIRGGVNIYPVEIENVIIEHPSVAEAQIFSIPDQRYGEEVCAWIKLKPNAPKCEPNDITKFLKDKIAFFKIPKHIRIVDKFIMTPTGKVQKFKLSEAMVHELKEVVDKKK
ncbi:unnamed protein product [Adineta steineri]|uniref:Medium-chain acyl-CoA ligase ACSF2, mitochondrial n=3 Tax=Adineta steineri TaxID=433720 RepID=A0A819XSB4_9BILA|nr:unnamed protein product [Adineta steineri]CAF3913610.1 unnamed protein product [Adineta steineri]CAF4140949.1 unnamed protein product [Adineta steineri]